MSLQTLNGFSQAIQCQSCRLQYESWLLESMLLPMKHYVPCLPDMSDLDTVLAAPSQPNKMRGDITKR